MGPARVRRLLGSRLFVLGAAGLLTGSVASAYFTGMSGEQVADATVASMTAPGSPSANAPGNAAVQITWTASTIAGASAATSVHGGALQRRRSRSRRRHVRHDPGQQRSTGRVRELRVHRFSGHGRLQVQDHCVLQLVVDRADGIHELRQADLDEHVGAIDLRDRRRDPRYRDQREACERDQRARPARSPSTCSGPQATAPTTARAAARPSGPPPSAEARPTTRAPGTPRDARHLLVVRQLQRRFQQQRLRQHVRRRDGVDERSRTRPDQRRSPRRRRQRRTPRSIRELDQLDAVGCDHLTRAGGTITFTVFGPQATAPTACTGGGTTVGTATVAGNGTYNPSRRLHPDKAGTYWWYAELQRRHQQQRLQQHLRRRHDRRPGREHRATTQTRPRRLDAQTAATPIEASSISSTLASGTAGATGTIRLRCSGRRRRRRRRARAAARPSGPRRWR